MATRKPPLTPGIFSEYLSDKIFTNNADHEFVQDKYRQTFTEAMSSAEELLYVGMHWSNHDLSFVVAALPWCQNLKYLGLGNNKITDITELARALASNSTLKTLDVRSNQITNVSEIGRALASNSALETLNISGNQISDITVLVSCLPTIATLKLLRLYSNPIPDMQKVALEEVWA